MKKLASLVALAASLPAPAFSQNIEASLRLYQEKDYEEAALGFYDVLAKDASPDTRDQAQIYLAESLKKMDLLLPALYYYQDIFSTGRQNRYYVNAVEGLLDIQRSLHDPVFVPLLVDSNFDPDGFGRLSPDRIASINYLIGEFSFRRGKTGDARQFLEYVPPESAYHHKARYLLGIIGVRQNKGEQALEHFKAIIAGTADAKDEEDLSTRHLALIAAGRTSYGMGRFEESSAYYGQVPRYSHEWFNALYESAWANFRQASNKEGAESAAFYGRSLGELQSVVSPYFQKRHVPEAYVIQGTAYFANCQWDRVRRAVDRFKRTYDPMGATLKQYLGQKRDNAEFYRDVVAGGNGKFDVELAREVRRSKRFKDYHYMLTHMQWELDELGRMKLWQGHSLAESAKDIIGKQRDELEPVVGTWVKRRLGFLGDQLQNFQNQINILDFEVTDAERQWLEQGKEINKGRRARLPRPEIPDDQWQHWSFDREFWRDEVGYFQHSLRSECD
jgi:tetratricopeptide (TPR) repeat protein